MKGGRFPYEKLSDEILAELRELARRCRGDILRMTTLASSGHPGGAMSSLEILIILYKFARIDPQNPYDDDRDRIVVSHGHISAGVYSVLGRLGFFDIDEAIAGFRHYRSPFEGHITRGIPGVEWTTGNLGQGLSAGVGFALSAKLRGKDYYTFVAMSDAEQAKGQVAEARRVARKYNLDNITVVIDYNDAQISGKASDIMPVNIMENYISDGWKVFTADGHDLSDLYEKIREAIDHKGDPTVVIAKTVIGKGVSFMENDVGYHGKPLKPEQFEKAMEELKLDSDLSRYRELREKLDTLSVKRIFKPPELNLKIDTGEPMNYGVEEKLDNRTAFGKALADLARLNNGEDGKTKVVVVDCDLIPSVKTGDFKKVSPEFLVEVGVQEHNAATIAGAMSVTDLLVFFADFGVFGVDETYNQQRLNDLNKTNLKVGVTHLGVDVGEDGKTHHCVDYIGVLRNLYSYKLILPADPNQTDRVVRYVAKNKGNFVIGMGRSKVSIIKDEDGNPFFGDDYEFEYGKVDVVRKGQDAVILTFGQLLEKAVQVHEKAKERGISVGVLNVSCPFHPDVETIRREIEGKHVITYEDHNVNTGLGSIISDLIVSDGIKVKSLTKIGLRDYAPSGKRDDLFKWAGFEVDNLLGKISELVMQ
ncbi:MAG: transketolase [Thermotoga sp.]|nr:MAG: transketolase [Thermotoga sp.]